MKHFLFKYRIGSRAAAGSFCQARPQLVIRLLALIVTTAGTSGLARAGDELPGQDQALARALENHPDIVAAKAKVALVEAELYGKRMEVSRQVLGLYGSLKMLDAQIDAAKAALNLSKKAKFERTKVAAASAALDQSTEDKMAAEVQADEGKLVQAMGQREQAEKELRLLIGAAPGVKEVKSPSEAAIPARQIPQGPIVGKWKEAAERPIKVEFVDTPLVEVVNFLSDKTGIRFSLQQQALDEAGVDLNEPITLSTNEVSLRAAVQGFEDAYPGLQFTLRDYGVLVTTEESADEHGYLPVLEIGKEPAGVKPR